MKLVILKLAGEEKSCQDIRKVYAQNYFWQKNNKVSVLKITEGQNPSY
jgi:hypothetical protein